VERGAHHELLCRGGLCGLWSRHPALPHSATAAAAEAEPWLVPRRIFRPAIVGLAPDTPRLEGCVEKKSPHPPRQRKGAFFEKGPCADSHPEMSMSLAASSQGRMARWILCSGAVDARLRQCEGGADFGRPVLHAMGAVDFLPDYDSRVPFRRYSLITLRDGHQIPKSVPPQGVDLSATNRLRLNAARACGPSSLGKELHRRERWVQCRMSQGGSQGGDRELKASGDESSP